MGQVAHQRAKYLKPRFPLPPPPHHLVGRRRRRRPTRDPPWCSRRRRRRPRLLPPPPLAGHAGARATLLPAFLTDDLRSIVRSRAKKNTLYLSLHLFFACTGKSHRHRASHSTEEEEEEEAIREGALQKSATPLPPPPPLFASKGLSQPAAYALSSHEELGYTVYTSSSLLSFFSPLTG